MTTTQCTGGFTLVEVLIALAIVAVGLGAAVRATIQVTSGAEQMKLRTIATWIAQDRLAENIARQSWPAPGAANGTTVQANVSFTWREAVSFTPDPAFRSVAIEVCGAAQPDYVLARLTGVLPMPAPSP